MKTLYQIFILFVFCCVCLVPFSFGENDEDNIARLLDKYTLLYPFASGYDVSLKSGGTPCDIYFKGEKILSKGIGTYCSGFTFYVAFSVLNDLSRFDKFEVARIRKFQKQWFGVEDKYSERQCVDALVEIGEGIEISNPSDLQPGDFIQFWRTNKTGHSAILLEIIDGDDGYPVGIEYISSQKSTDGIARKTEFFVSVSSEHGIDRNRIYGVRLKG